MTLASATDLRCDPDMRAFALLAVVGCSEPKRAEPEPKPAPAPATELSADAATASLRGLHAVKFTDDVLDECVDATITVTPPDDARADKAIATMLEGLGKPTMIKRPCRDEFPGRTIFATCQGRVSDKGITLEFGSTSFSLPPDDTRMRDCLALGGEWNELPADSWEVKRAELDRAAKELRR